MPNPNFNLLDTATGDRVLNADAISAIMAADPVPGEFSTLETSGDADIGGDTNVTGDVAAMGNISGKYLAGSVGAALTAVGTNRGTALQLAAAVNNVSTALSGTGVTLPLHTDVGEGGIVDIYSNGANAIKVYALNSETIDGTAGATGVTLTNTKRCQYTVIGGNWISAQLGVVSA
jgi:hypothetical protein